MRFRFLFVFLLFVLILFVFDICFIDTFFLLQNILNALLNITHYLNQTEEKHNEGLKEYNEFIFNF